MRKLGAFHKFVFYIWLPLNIIIYGYSLISYSRSIFSNTSEPISFTSFGALLFAAFYFIAPLFSFIGFLKRRNYARVLLIWDSVFKALASVLVILDAFLNSVVLPSDMVLVVAYVVCVVISIAIIIYYSRRKNCFVDDSAELPHQEIIEDRDLSDHNNQNVVRTSRISSSRESDKKYCNVCGKPLIKGASFCLECGAPVSNNDSADNRIADATQLSPSEMSPKLRRAYIFIEDEEWDRAEDYLESILDDEPENPYAYLGKAMIKVKVRSPFDLSEEEINSLKKVRSYHRAKDYADGKLKKIFDYWESL